MSNAAVSRQAGNQDDSLGMTVEQAAVKLGVSRAHAYRMVTDGSLPSIRLRRRIVVSQAALVELFENANTKLPVVGGVEQVDSVRPDVSGATAGAIGRTTTETGETHETAAETAAHWGDG